MFGLDPWSMLTGRGIFNSETMNRHHCNYQHYVIVFYLFHSKYQKKIKSFVRPTLISEDINLCA